MIVDGHRSRLGFFVDWCEDRGIDNLNDLTARDLHEFQVSRRDDLNVVSARCNVTPTIIDEHYEVRSGGEDATAPTSA